MSGKSRIKVKIDNVVYDSIREAADTLGICSEALRQRIARNKPMFGHTYEYVDEARQRKVVENINDQTNPILKELGLKLTENNERLNNCLTNEKIFTMEQLLNHTEVDLLKTPNFGFKSLKVLTDALAKKNLHLAEVFKARYEPELEECLTIRAVNIMRCIKLKLEDIMKMSDEELLKIPNLGRKTLKQMRLGIAYYLKLKEKQDA